MAGVPRGTIELAWAAGFFDGEGTITLTQGARPGRDFSFYVGVNQATASRALVACPHPIERFAAVVSLGSVGGPYFQDQTRRPIFKWYALNRNGIAVLALLWPYLSSPKREQAEAAFGRWRLTTPRAAAFADSVPWAAAA